MDRFERDLQTYASGGMYDISQAEKERRLCGFLNMLHEHHCHASEHYRRLFHDYPNACSSYEKLPLIAVRLFKMLTMSSVPRSDIFRVLTSSGTTAQVPAKITLDRATSARQSKVLVRIVQEFAGKSRLPMLIVDAPSLLSNRSLSARAAGIQGMMFFGRDHTFALNDDLSLNEKVIREFTEKYQDKPVLIFGFTYIVYLHFVQEIIKRNLSFSLPKGILFHSGGWKKMTEHAVTNTMFKKHLKSVCGIPNVHNFYGMAEQVGSVYMECEHGVLHAPVVSDVVIRDPYTLQPLGIGQKGLIQVLSALPTSYPGFSVLTEDMGRLLGEDDCPCGRKGRYFEVLGRLPKSEVRGCSDIGGET